MEYMHNCLAAAKPITGATTFYTPELEVDPGKIVTFMVLIDSLTVNGASAVGLAAKFQLAPIDFAGYVIDAQPSGDRQPWFDTVAADGRLGHLCLDGAWAASLLDVNLPSTQYGVRDDGAALTGKVAHSRRILVPSNMTQVRLALTQTYTGGTGPVSNVTIFASWEA